MNKFIAILGVILVGIINFSGLTMCNVTDLKDYDFEQIGETQEYVCVSPNDHTDFVVIKDYENKYEVGMTIKNPNK